MTRACLRRLRRCERGGVAVEFAIVGLLLCLTVVGIVELGRAFYLRSDLAYAADVAGRHILMRADVPVAELEKHVRTAVTATDPASVEITLSTETVNTVAFRTVVLSSPLQLLLPGMHQPMVLTITRRIPLV